MYTVHIKLPLKVNYASLVSTSVCARGTQSSLLACTFILRGCALLSSGLSTYEEMYTVQLK